MWKIVILLVCVVLSVNGKSQDQPLKNSAQEGDKRSNVDPLHDAEQAAGKAVLKLLDAKIGKKVQDAAKEVTNFLTSAIGSHATTRADAIREDKQKEMSLLHLGAMTKIKKVVNKHKDKPKLHKKKDGSFLVHFKIPYIVTPLGKKKKPVHKPMHNVVHPKHKPALDKPPPIEVHSHPGNITELDALYAKEDGNPTTQDDGSSIYHHAAVSSPYSQSSGYATGYGASNMAQQTPCQGMCTNPCSAQQAAPAAPPPVASPLAAAGGCCCPDPSAALSVPAMQVPAPPMPAVPGMCPQICKRACVSKCPSYCCGIGKRNKVEKPNKEKKAEKKVKHDKEDKEDDETSKDQREEGSANESENDEDSVE